MPVHSSMVSWQENESASARWMHAVYMSTNTQWSKRMDEGFSKSSVNNEAKTPLVLKESLDHNTIKPQKAGTKLTSPFEDKISSCGCLTREKNGAAPATHGLQPL